MDSCDVLIVGGGPGGSSCAWKLRQAGLDVLVMDRAEFPRDKVCAGWITPQVVDDLDLDVDDYRRSRTFQPITAFRTGLIGRGDWRDTTYQGPVSFGIRRCEFDHYLLQRAKARLRLGVAASTIRRDGDGWIVDETVRAKMLVGAGGHFCPVARHMNDRAVGAPLVLAQEAELEIESMSEAPTVEGTKPELFFSPDLKGYGWCFRKGSYFNIGLGRQDARSLPSAVNEFVNFLKARGSIPRAPSWRWRGHAYLLADPPRRRVYDEGVVLVGDAAGLAYARSGEGIRPAIESGLLAAATIVEAAGCYSRDRLRRYEDQLRERFQLQAKRTASQHGVGVRTPFVPWFFNRPWFVRHLLLDRWFLRTGESALAVR
jgi:geranylgeranyl reductase family protein